MRLPLRPRRRPTEPADAPPRRWWQARRSLGIAVLLAAVVTASAPGWLTYHVRQGDTLSEIAARYHVTVAQLAAVNGLPGHGNLVYAGTVLRVPARGAGTVSRPTARRAGRGTAYRTYTSAGRYWVRRGDSLGKIAKRYHTSVRALKRGNHLRGARIYPGQRILVPVRIRVAARVPARSHARSRSSANTFAGRTYPSATVRAAAHNRAILAQRRVPSRAQVRHMIRRTARAFGVDPALALAVSYQESGHNQRRVSVANAIGAMQVVPSTGAFISSVVGRRLDLLKTRDNVIAGVVLLRILTRAAPLPQAVAGYYQGLGSVRANGMYPDTKVYVRNVLALRARYR